MLTRGMGGRKGQTSAGLISQGLTGFIQRVVEGVTVVAERVKIYGQSGAKRAAREIDRLTVWAKMVSVNGTSPAAEVKGAVAVDPRVPQRNRINLVEFVSSRTRHVWEGIKVTVRRLR